MTVALLELAAGGFMLYAAIKCRKLIPMFAGRDEPGTHCTGSLIVAVGAVLGRLLWEILTAAGLGGLLAAAGARAARRSGGRTLPRPAPTPLPAPGGGDLNPGPNPNPPQLPPARPVPSPGGEGLGLGSALAYQAQAVPVSAATFQGLMG